MLAHEKWILSESQAVNSNWVSSPQYIRGIFLLHGYWVSEPDQMLGKGQRTHRFLKVPKRKYTTKLGEAGRSSDSYTRALQFRSNMDAILGHMVIIMLYEYNSTWKSALGKKKQEWAMTSDLSRSGKPMSLDDRFLSCITRDTPRVVTMSKRSNSDVHRSYQ